MVREMRKKEKVGLGTQLGVEWAGGEVVCVFWGERDICVDLVLLCYVSGPLGNKINFPVFYKRGVISLSKKK